MCTKLIVTNWQNSAVRKGVEQLGSYCTAFIGLLYCVLGTQTDVLLNNQGNVFNVILLCSSAALLMVKEWRSFNAAQK